MRELATAVASGMAPADVFVLASAAHRHPAGRGRLRHRRVRQQRVGRRRGRVGPQRRAGAGARDHPAAHPRRRPAPHLPPRAGRARRSPRGGQAGRAHGLRLLADDARTRARTAVGRDRGGLRGARFAAGGRRARPRRLRRADRFGRGQHQGPRGPRRAGGHRPADGPREPPRLPRAPRAEVARAQRHGGRSPWPSSTSTTSRRQRHPRSPGGDVVQAAVAATRSTCPQRGRARAGGRRRVRLLMPETDEPRRLRRRARPGRVAGIELGGGRPVTSRPASPASARQRARRSSSGSPTGPCTGPSPTAATRHRLRARGGRELSISERADQPAALAGAGRASARGARPRRQGPSGGTPSASPRWRRASPSSGMDGGARRAAAGAALVHDVGKIGAPDDVLLKPAASPTTSARASPSTWRWASRWWRTC